MQNAYSEDPDQITTAYKNKRAAFQFVTSYPSPTQINKYISK